MRAAANTLSSCLLQLAQMPYQQTPTEGKPRPFWWAKQHVILPIRPSEYTYNNTRCTYRCFTIAQKLQNTNSSTRRDQVNSIISTDAKAVPRPLTTANNQPSILDSGSHFHNKRPAHRYLLSLAPALHLYYKHSEALPCM